MDKVKQEDEEATPKRKPSAGGEKRPEGQDRRKAPRRAPEFNPTSRGDESGEVT